MSVTGSEGARDMKTELGKGMAAAYDSGALTQMAEWARSSQRTLENYARDDTRTLEDRKAFMSDADKFGCLAHYLEAMKGGE